MFKLQIRRVEHGTFGAASVWERPTVQWTVVDAFATERSACFSQMDAHLMRPARLQPAFDQRELAERFDDAHMGHGMLPFYGVAAAAPAVASIRGDLGLNTGVLSLATHERKIVPARCVGAKLFAELTFRFGRPRQHEEAARHATNP